MTTRRPAAIILAGGLGRRMGGAIKPLLAIDGVTVLERQLAALRAVGVSEIALSVAPSPPAELVAAASAHRLALVVDRIAEQGPLGGISAGLGWTPEPSLLCLAGDLPFVAPALLALLCDRAAGAVDAVVPRHTGGDEPLVAVYGLACAPLVASRLHGGLRRARELPAALVATRLVVDLVDDATLRTVAIRTSGASRTGIERPISGDPRGEIR